MSTSSTRQQLTLQNSGTLDPHTHTIPGITQTPPFLHHFGGELRSTLAAIDSVEEVKVASSLMVPLVVEEFD
jgi:hypothetical protein